MPAGHMGLVLLYSSQLQRGMMDYMSPGSIVILIRPRFSLKGHGSQIINMINMSIQSPLPLCMHAFSGSMSDTAPGL